MRCPAAARGAPCSQKEVAKERPETRFEIVALSRVVSLVVAQAKCEMVDSEPPSDDEEAPEVSAPEPHPASSRPQVRLLAGN